MESNIEDCIPHTPVIGADFELGILSQLGDMKDFG